MYFSISKGGTKAQVVEELRGAPTDDDSTSTAVRRAFQDALADHLESHAGDGSVSLSVSVSVSYTAKT